jgi:hypothetical protein
MARIAEPAPSMVRLIISARPATTAKPIAAQIAQRVANRFTRSASHRRQQEKNTRRRQAGSRERGQ